MRLVTRSFLAVALPLVIVSCSSDDAIDSTTLTVFAAASLVDAFTDLGSAFESENPGVTVDFNFASSSDLAIQIIEGAPADVFASADEANVDRVRDGAISLGESRFFATNVLEILVESGNPKDINSLSDLADPNLIYITCDTAVPIGRYSAQILDRAGVTVIPQSYEENVKGIVNKILLGEADAGIVYRTDVIAAGTAAEGVTIPNDVNVITTYPIATLGDTPSASARAFVEFVTSSPIAREILVRYGFGTP